MACSNPTVWHTREGYFSCVEVVFDRLIKRHVRDLPDHQAATVRSCNSGVAWTATPTSGAAAQTRTDPLGPSAAEHPASIPTTAPLRSSRPLV